MTPDERINGLCEPLACSSDVFDAYCMQDPIKAVIAHALVKEGKIILHPRKTGA